MKFAINCLLLLYNETAIFIKLMLEINKYKYETKSCSLMGFLQISKFKTLTSLLPEKQIKRNISILLKATRIKLIESSF